jgi:hypothetical protein
MEFPVMNGNTDNFAGNIDNLRAIIRREGEPSKQSMYLFNGDFIDRGPCSTETLFLLLTPRERYPLYVLASVRISGGKEMLTEEPF